MAIKPRTNTAAQALVANEIVKPIVRRPETSTPLQVNRRISRLRVVPMVTCAAAAVWSAGLVLYDSWMRPWPVIVIWCSVLTGVAAIAGVIYLLGYRVFAMGLCLVVALFTIPVPSFARYATIINSTDAALEVQIASADGVRRKESILIPGQIWKFCYFSGDNDGRTAISATIRGKKVSTAALFMRPIELPVPSPGPTIKITEDWFHE